MENALLKRALGYEYDEITYENGEEVKRVTKQVAPDITAQIFWLKNRKPQQRRDNHLAVLPILKFKLKKKKKIYLS